MQIAVPIQLSTPGVINMDVPSTEECHLFLRFAACFNSRAFLSSYPHGCEPDPIVIEHNSLSISIGIVQMDKISGRPGDLWYARADSFWGECLLPLSIPLYVPHTFSASAYVHSWCFSLSYICLYSTFFDLLCCSLPNILIEHLSWARTVRQGSLVAGNIFALATWNTRGEEKHMAQRIRIASLQPQSNDHCNWYHFGM